MRLLGNILLLAFGMINLALGILTLVEGLMDNGLEGLYLPYGKLRYAIFLFLGTWCSAGAAVNLLRLELANYLDDEEYRELQKYLLADPIAGELVPRSGDVRKLRWKRPGTGKRDAIRVIYYVQHQPNECRMLTLYAKAKQENAPAHILKALKETFHA